MPWLVFIHANDSIIPGTLISNRHVITAASRVYDLSPSTVFVQIGSNNFCSNNGLNFTVEAIRIPGGYTPGGDNDLALLRLANEVSFNQYISPICLPFSWRDYTRRTATVSTLPIYDSGSRCIARPTTFSLLERSTCSYQANFTMDKGCVEPTGPLYTTLSDEDVGAPVMTRRPGIPHLRPFRLIGVLSSASNSSEPSIYTKINDHRSFIYQNTQGDCMCV
ncbi:proclotting enzyme-like [Colias croceus]|uniref:proclotting enzyme-like n=1 Tax=Colias crocea TaxID=72248 RepID=UPI001E27F478|nr:proclotting enzyme-like [Colias croceus]XP_045496324.1 proclotting enzyme-like [Colias croceus]